jgi:hypothetical protein
MIQLGAMPLRQFIALHPDSKLTAEDLAALKAYLAPWGATPSLSNSAIGRDEVRPTSTSSPAVRPEHNGLTLDPSFERWRLLSSTDRGDNNTFRFVLGNDIASKAAQSGNISPWPDGARFAKMPGSRNLAATV